MLCTISPCCIEKNIHKIERYLIPDGHVRITSVIYLMTARLDGVVDRCNQRWLTLCERQHRYPQLTLSTLESDIVAELEGFYLRQHGEEKGRQIACALLEDLMEAGPLKAAPSLSFLGLAVMDELCARHITAPALH